MEIDSTFHQLTKILKFNLLSILEKWCNNVSVDI